MNPFTAVLNDLGLTNGATGPAGCLHLLLTFGRDAYGSTVTAQNPPHRSQTSVPCCWRARAAVSAIKKSKVF